MSNIFGNRFGLLENNTITSPMCIFVADNTENVCFAILNGVASRFAPPTNYFFVSHKLLPSPVLLTSNIFHGNHFTFGHILHQILELRHPMLLGIFSSRGSYLRKLDCRLLHL